MHIIISCRNPYIFVIRERCLKCGRWTHFGRDNVNVTAWCTPTPPNQCPYQVSTFYTLWNQRKNPDKILKLIDTMTRSKVKSRSHHEVAHLQPPTNVPTKYQLSSPYGFRDTARTRFIGQGHYSKVKGQIKVTLRPCTPTPPNQLPYQVSTTYTLRFLRYSPDKLFPLGAVG